MRAAISVRNPLISLRTTCTKSVETIVICPARLGWRGGVEELVKKIAFEKAICSPYLTRSSGGLMDLLTSRRIERICLNRSDTLNACGWKLRVAAPQYPPPEGEGVPMDEAGIRIEYRRREGGGKIEN